MNNTGTIPKQKLAAITKSYLKLINCKKIKLPIEILCKYKNTIEANILWEESDKASYSFDYPRKNDYTVSELTMEKVIHEKIAPHLDKHNKSIKEWTTMAKKLCHKYNVPFDDLMDIMYSAEDANSVVEKRKQKIIKMEKELASLKKLV